MAKTYLKHDADTYVELDTSLQTALVIRKSELETQLAAARARLAALPVVDDAYLLKWAREHFDQMDIVRERQTLVAVVAGMQGQLDEIAKVK